MNGERTLQRGWRPVASAALLGLVGAAGVLAPQPASAEIFEIFSTSPPGKITAIDGATGTKNVFTGPTSPMQDVALRITDDPLTTLIWGISKPSGQTPSQIWTIEGAAGSATSILKADVTGVLASITTNALAWNADYSLMYTGAKTLDGLYTVDMTGGSAFIGAYTSDMTGINSKFLAAHPLATGTYAYTVTTEGDMVMAIDPADQLLKLYATLHIHADPSSLGPSANIDETWLATINVNTGAATLIGRTNNGSTNVALDGLALDYQPGGPLWGTLADEVYTINIATGALTPRWTIAGLGSIGATGVVPEPATLGLIGTGLAGLWAVRRRQRRAA